MTDYFVVKTVPNHNTETGITEYLVYHSRPETKEEPFPDWKKQRIFLARCSPNLKHIVLMAIDKESKSVPPVPDIIDVYHTLDSAQNRLKTEAEKYTSQLKKELGLKD